MNTPKGFTLLSDIGPEYETLFTEGGEEQRRNKYYDATDQLFNVIAAQQGFDPYVGVGEYNEGFSGQYQRSPDAQKFIEGLKTKGYTTAVKPTGADKFDLAVLDPSGKELMRQSFDESGKDFALQAALMIGGSGVLGPTGKLLSKGIGALASKDPVAILSALGSVPGASNYIPPELSKIADYANKAASIGQAIKSGNPVSILTSAIGSGALPKGFAGELDLSEPIQEGFFDPGGPGYMPPDVAAFPEDFGYVGDVSDVTEFLPAEEVIRERNSLEDRYGQSAYTLDPKTSMSPVEMSQFLEANIDDPGTIETLMQDYFPELYTQRIETTATRGDTGTAPRSIRDVGNVTQIQPGEKLDGTTVVEPDLSKNLPGAQVDKKTTPGKQATPAKTTDKKGPGIDALLAALAAMNQRPEKEEEQQAGADMPFYDDLMYGLTSRYA